MWNAEKKICDWPYNVKDYKPQDTKGLRMQKGNRIAKVLKRTNLGATQRTNK